MAGLSDNTRGALFMVASMAAFTLNDACLKAMGAEIPLMQALFMRGLAVSVFLGAAVRMQGGLRLGQGGADKRRIGVRLVAEIAAASLFLTALFNMPIANVVAILQALPLALTLAAAAFLGESVGWRRYLAIGIGLAGVSLIVRPGSEGFSIYAVYALLAVAAVVVRDLVTRRISRSVPTMSIAFITSVGLTAFAGLMSLGAEWVPVIGVARWQLLGAVVAIFAAYTFSVATMRVGDVGFIAPFRYTSLIVALILGWLAFGEWPDPLTLLGSAIVVATGLFTLWRERVAAVRSIKKESVGH